MRNYTYIAAGDMILGGNGEIVRNFICQRDRMKHFPGGAVTRTPYERLTDPGGTYILQDLFGGGLGIRKAYGYRYEMRDPDQPEREGFDLGDFLRSTLTGGPMGGLSGVAFFGVGRAAKALKGSLSGGTGR